MKMNLLYLDIEKSKIKNEQKELTIEIASYKQKINHELNTIDCIDVKNPINHIDYKEPRLLHLKKECKITSNFLIVLVNVLEAIEIELVGNNILEVIY